LFTGRTIVSEIHCWQSFRHSDQGTITIFETRTTAMWP
jgi:hypothetical protein